MPALLDLVKAIPIFTIMVDVIYHCPTHTYRSMLELQRELILVLILLIACAGPGDMRQYVRLITDNCSMIAICRCMLLHEVYPLSYNCSIA